MPVRAPAPTRLAPSTRATRSRYDPLLPQPSPGYFGLPDHRPLPTLRYVSSHPLPACPPPARRFSLRQYLATPRVDFVCYLRFSILGLAFLMLILDSIHIGQLRYSWRQLTWVPWPFSEFLGTSSPDGPAPSEEDLHGYYLKLLIPDLMAMGMMLWLCFGRRCMDQWFHRGLRVFFAGVLVILVMWYPCEEIRKVRAYTQRMFGDGSTSTDSGGSIARGSIGAGGSGGGSGGGFGNGYQWTPPSAGEVYFCFLNHQDVAPISPFVNCGVYRTRSVFAFVLVLMVAGEMALAFKQGEFRIS
ncbi:hypothetical protein BC939DRAFT_507332 [Gamsiella multidivaricata]|uniref:uncharacterized protein n=1 Tax=Gamsiella multidivaricata TaxID=101098 RepID=UPI00221E5B6B|nr:uncharacterized protein BC939DRAFT_507332 [Gamsiella multidivaricata]KAI7817537.1 hypothetical protein BC939DRAFT_507332 [Gamsiella multidivaricata]